LCVLDDDEDCCSTKRASVLEAAGGPEARESLQGDSSQSLPQNLRESAVAEFDRLRNDPVTSQVILEEWTAWAGPLSPLGSACHAERQSSARQILT